MNTLFERYLCENMMQPDMFHPSSRPLKGIYYPYDEVTQFVRIPREEGRKQRYRIRLENGKSYILTVNASYNSMGEVWRIAMFMIDEESETMKYIMNSVLPKWDLSEKNLRALILQDSYLKMSNELINTLAKDIDSQLRPTYNRF